LKLFDLDNIFARRAILAKEIAVEIATFIIERGGSSP
jgi:hypothetical protein